MFVATRTYAVAWTRHVCVQASEQVGALHFCLQYEGAYKEGGKGLSVWDIFSHIPGLYEFIYMLNAFSVLSGSPHVWIWATESDRRLVLSNWHHAENLPTAAGKIKNNDTGDVADDFYHRYKVIAWNTYY